ncbi:MAG: hypothetical protein ACKOC8_07835 [Pirellulales bacterium]
MRDNRGYRPLVAVLAVMAVTVGGCSADTKKPRSASGGGAIAAVDPDSAITVDGGRISVRSPVGWRRGARSDEYVVRYTPGKKSTPSITVTAADPPAGITAVTADNHDKFVAAVTEGLAETFTSGGKSTLLKKPAATKLGPHLGAAWTAPGTAKVDGLKQPIERSCVAIVTAGRMYTVEARAPKGRLDDAGRAAARGVAAGIGEPVTEESLPTAGEGEGEPAPPPAEEPVSSEEPAAVTE